MADSGTSTYETAIEQARLLVEGELHAAFDIDDPPVAPLAQAIEYSLHAGGKRIRPILFLAAADACGAELERVAKIATAFELVHAYSLVHDDLPAMDDDDVRRGTPTNHKVYGEGVAILVGDALQTRAFELIADEERVEPAVRLDIVRLLAHAAGWQGMVGGQFLDIDEERHDVGDVAGLRDVHDRKTGALIAAAVEAGAAAAGASVTDRLAFNAFGRALGWLFQLVDDLLDATGDVAAPGCRRAACPLPRPRRGATERWRAASGYRPVRPRPRPLNDGTRYPHR